MLPLVLLLRTIKPLNQAFNLNAEANTLRLLWKETPHAEGGWKRWQHLFWKVDNRTQHDTYATILTSWCSRTVSVVLRSGRRLPPHRCGYSTIWRWAWTAGGHQRVSFTTTALWTYKLCLIINEVKIVFFILTGMHWQLSSIIEINIADRKYSFLNKIRTSFAIYQCT